MASQHHERVLDAVVMVPIVLEAVRHHRQLQRRVSNLDALRRLLINTCVEYLTSDRVPVTDMVALMRETLDGTDTSVRKTIAGIRQLAERRQTVHGHAAHA
jgi:hypothetical protein